MLRSPLTDEQAQLFLDYRLECARNGTQPLVPMKSKALRTMGNLTYQFSIKSVFKKLEAGATTLPWCLRKGPAWVANPFNELVDKYPDLRSDRVNLLKARELDPDHPLCFKYICALVEAMTQESERGNPFSRCQRRRYGPASPSPN